VKFRRLDCRVHFGHCILIFLIIFVKYRSKYGGRLNASNLMFCKQLLQIVVSLVKQLKIASDVTKVETVRELIQSSKLELIDLFSLVNYMAKSLIANKVKGFYHN
jgi:hypothetical protein